MHLIFEYFFTLALLSYCFVEVCVYTEKVCAAEEPEAKKTLSTQKSSAYLFKPYWRKYTIYFTGRIWEILRIYTL